MLQELARRNVVRPRAWALGRRPCALPAWASPCDVRPGCAFGLIFEPADLRRAANGGRARRNCAKCFAAYVHAMARTSCVVCRKCPRARMHFGAHGPRAAIGPKRRPAVTVQRPPAPRASEACLSGGLLSSLRFLGTRVLDAQREYLEQCLSGTVIFGAASCARVRGLHTLDYSSSKTPISVGAEGRTARRRNAGAQGAMRARGTPPRHLQPSTAHFVAAHSDWHFNGARARAARGREAHRCRESRRLCATPRLFAFATAGEATSAQECEEVRRLRRPCLCQQRKPGSTAVVHSTAAPTLLGATARHQRYPLPAEC